ncbi:MAG: efflux RND transporter periplasmic adaptor subunit [Burkholderiaceae bacterium]|nr:efflux RND transporter periplasmic adaptor subunit [Burkholderiaceae bacterium]
MQKRTVTLVAISGLVAAGLAAYLLQRSPSTPAADGKAAAATAAPAVKADGKGDMKAAKGGPGGPVPVEVVQLAPQRVVEELQAVGTMRANQSVVLRPEVTGRVAAIGFRDGQYVKKGQLLVGLDAALNEAEVAQAKAELALANANLKRTADLASKNFVSSSAQDTAESNVTVLEARLQLAQARLAKMRIVAPFDGVVGLRAISIGDVVKDGTDLVNVEDIGRLKVDFRLPERTFTQLKVGQAVEVTTDAVPGALYKGRVDAINPRIESGGRSLEVRAELPNTDGKLRPGMFARVPQGDNFFVFRVVDDKAQRVPVKLGVRRDGQVELLDNVKPGDRVVTAGMRVQRDGQPVRVLGSAAPAGADARSAAAPDAKGGAAK